MPEVEPPVDTWPPETIGIGGDAPLGGDLRIVTLDLYSMHLGYVGSNPTAPRQFVAAGGVPPYRWQTSAGRLPAGLALDPGGRLVGRQTSPGRFPFEIAVTDAAGAVATRGYLVAVKGPDLEFAEEIDDDEGAFLPAAVVGRAYDQAIAAIGGVPPYRATLRAGSLPPGMRLDQAGLRLAGTPLRGGAYRFSIRIDDAAGAAVSRMYAMQVGDLRIVTESLPRIAAPGDGPWLYLGRIECLGAIGLIRCTAEDVPQGMIAGSNGQFASIAGTTAFRGGFTTRVTVTDQAGQRATADLTGSLLNGAEQGPIELQDAAVGIHWGFGESIGWVGPHGTQGVTVTLEGDPPPGCELRFGPDRTWYNVGGIPQSAGDFAFAVTQVARDGRSRRVQCRVRVHDAPPELITPSLLPTAWPGREYETILRYDDQHILLTRQGWTWEHRTRTARPNDPRYRFAVIDGALPDGLALDERTGRIAGTPTVVGASAACIAITDRWGQRDQQWFVIEVARPHLRIATGALPGATLYAPYSHRLHLEHDPRDLLRPLDERSRPDPAGWPQDDDEAMDMDDDSGDVEFRSPPAEADYVGRPTRDGDAAHTWRVEGLPPGLGFDAARGEISGTVDDPQAVAAADGRFPVRVSIEDAFGNRDVATLWLGVAEDDRLSWHGGDTVGWVRGRPEGVQLEAHGGVGGWRRLFAPPSGPPRGMRLTPGGFLYTLEGLAEHGAHVLPLGILDAEAQIRGRALVVDVIEPWFRIATRTLPNARHYETYWHQLIGDGPGAPYRFRVAQGDLPPGLALSEDGIISGTAPEAGAWQVVIAGEDANGMRATRAYVISVKAPVDDNAGPGAVGALPPPLNDAGTRLAGSHAASMENQP